MRAVWAVAALAGFLAAAVTGCSAGTSAPVQARRAAPPASYYLSLGDSLSQGVQPDAAGLSVDTRDGYPDQLYAALRPRHPGLRLVKLGCNGETTATMINGGICSYPAGSQLAAAVRFLGAHRGRVSLITIDIGANDPDSCITRPSVVKLVSCAGRAIPQATANLAKILASLRRAAPGTRMIAMNYYLPTLAQWRNGLIGQALARLTEVAAAAFNALLTRTYQAYGVRVADVSAVFQSADFGQQVSLPGYGALPRNVASICSWTWECAAPPRGPNEHPNQAGYAVIARAFQQAGPERQRHELATALAGKGRCGCPIARAARPPRRIARSPGPIARLEAADVEIKMVLFLPRDAASVPVTRQVLAGCLDTLGVTADTRLDIALALSEACANVIRHAGPGDEYEVLARVTGGRCVIEVVNTGNGQGVITPGRGMAPLDAEHGRGLKIMDAVVDELSLTGNGYEGTTVHFEKALLWEPGAAGELLFSEGR